MELQWPLIIFTTLTAWSAGLFATQAWFAFKGEARKSQLASLVVSVVLLAISGIAVFTHLQHWERIFNGFGHLTSGITQELIAIVLLIVVAFVFFVYLRRSEDGTVPKVVAVLAMAISVILVVVMAHSYMMAARPVWDTPLWILYVLGNACVLGPATFAVIMAVRGDEADFMSKTVVAGSLVNAVTSIIYVIAMQFAGSSYVSVGYHIDPTDPSRAIVDPSSMGLLGDQALIIWVFVILVGAVVPAVLSICGGRQGQKASWKVLGGAIVIAALIGAVCLRVAFYQMGIPVISLY